MDNVIKKIKAKKPLDRLDDDFVRGFVEGFFKKNFKLKKRFLDEKLKEKDFGIVVKSVRNELNKVYGQFWIQNDISLDAHKSTKERKDFFSKLYKEIFSVIEKPRKILDLGCGLNPLAYRFIPNYNNICFIAVELTDYDCNNLRRYFRDTGIKGEVIKADLRSYDNFPDADVCFMFKLLDGIGYDVAERLLSKIDTKYFIVSFSTEDVRGKRMNYPRRGWFERMLKRLGYRYTKREYSNEIFYIVKR